jgi:hypothetical protein
MIVLYAVYTLYIVARACDFCVDARTKVMFP